MSCVDLPGRPVRLTSRHTNPFRWFSRYALPLPRLEVRPDDAPPLTSRHTNRSPPRRSGADASAGRGCPSLSSARARATHVAATGQICVRRGSHGCSCVGDSVVCRGRGGDGKEERSWPARHRHRHRAHPGGRRNRRGAGGGGTRGLAGRRRGRRRGRGRPGGGAGGGAPAGGGALRVHDGRRHATVPCGPGTTRLTRLEVRPDDAPPLTSRHTNSSPRTRYHPLTRLEGVSTAHVQARQPSHPYIDFPPTTTRYPLSHLQCPCPGLTHTSISLPPARGSVHPPCRRRPRPRPGAGPGPGLGTECPRGDHRGHHWGRHGPPATPIHRRPLPLALAQAPAPATSIPQRLHHHHPAAPARRGRGPRRPRRFRRGVGGRGGHGQPQPGGATEPYSSGTYSPPWGTPRVCLGAR